MKSSIFTPFLILTSALALPSPEVAQFVQVVPITLSPERLTELNTFHPNTTSLLPRQGACFFQAFSAGTCGQPAGNQIFNPNGCIDTRYRHTFFVSSGCVQGLRVSVQENTGCPGGNNGGIYGPGCYLVNTGRNWQSSFVTGV